MLNIIKLSYLAGGLPPSAQLEMFSKMKIPIITYGAEIWGSRVERYIEHVQVKCCKQIFGLSSSASRAAALKVNCKIEFITFLLKLTTLDSANMTRATYVMLCNLDKIGRHTWDTEVRDTLHLYGFVYVWIERKI